MGIMKMGFAMLHNKMSFCTKCCLFALATTFVVPCAFAASSNSTNVKTGWTQNNSTLTWDMPNDYLLAGCSGSSLSPQCSGTYSDEGAIVFNMARKFNDRGGYFCPTQVQVGNQNKKQLTKMNFYEPVDAAPCKWLCIDGYKGPNCEEQDNGDNIDTTSLKLLKKGSVRKSGESSNRVTSTIDLFAIREDGYSNARDAYVEVLAILKYLDHGVLVGPLWVYGDRDWGGFWGSDISSWVSKAHGTRNKDREQILCAEGYKVNNEKTDCVVINPDAVPKSMCSGWTEAEYNAHATDFEYYNDGDCRKFRCSDRNKAFPSAGNRTCEPCSTGVRGGADANGVCKRCDLAQYFDETDGTCKTALGLSKSDLQYGRGKSNTGNVKDQCWTKTDPDAYKCCVIGDWESCVRAAANGTNVQSGYTSTVSYADTKNDVMAQRLSAADAGAKQPGF